MPLRTVFIWLSVLAVLAVSPWVSPAGAACRDFWNSAESFDDIAQAYWEQERWDRGASAYLTAVFFWERAGLACRGPVAARAVNNANHARYRSRLADCKGAFSRARRLFDNATILSKSRKRNQAVETFVEAARSFAEAAQVCGGPSGERAGLNASVARQNERRVASGASALPAQPMAPEDPKMVRLPWDPEEAGKVDPLDASGQKALQLGALDGAIKPQIDDLVGENPRRRAAQVLVQRGVAWLDIGRWQRALQEFTQAAQLNPQMPEASLGKARALHRLGQAQEGMAEVKRYLALVPNDPKGTRLQKELQDRLTRKDFNPSPPPTLGRPRQPSQPWFNLAWLGLLATGAGWRALALYCLAPWVLGAALVLSGLVRRWSRVLALGLGLAWIWFGLTFFWRDFFLGPGGPSPVDLSRAALLVIPLLVLLVRAPWSRAPLSFENRDLNLGRAALVSGRYRDAVEHLTQVVSQGKVEDVREALRDRIIAHARQGHLEQAVADCRRFIELAPMNPVGPRLLQMLEGKLKEGQALAPEEENSAAPPAEPGVPGDQANKI